MLDELLVKYNELQMRENEIAAEKATLKSQILEELEKMNATEYTSTDGSLKGSISSKVTFKYTDEAGIMNYLKMHGMSQYLKTAINTTDLNKQLKTSNTLQEALTGKFTRQESQALTVKKL